MDSQHYVDQYIRNKRSGDYNSTSRHPTPNSSSATAAPPAPTNSSGNHYRSSSLGGGGGHRQTSSISSAAQHLLSAAQRAQHEVDNVNGAAEQLAMHQETAERVERQHQLLTDRIDATAQKAEHNESKITQFAQLVSRMKQDILDNDRKLREENTELRAKLKRLEKHLDQEREVRQQQTENLHTYVREHVGRIVDERVNILRVELDRQAANNQATLETVHKDQQHAKSQLDEVRAKADTFLQLKREVQDFCETFSANERKSNRESLNKHLEEFRIKNDDINEKIRDARCKIEDMNEKIEDTTQSQNELRRKFEDVLRRSDPVKDWCEDKLVSLRKELREFIVSEDETLSANLHRQIATANQCIEINENGYNELRQELEALALSTDSRIKKSEDQSAKSVDNVQDLRQVTEQSRELLVQQLEATKEWASRNIMRLKKHLDLAVSDMAATRQAQLEIQSNFSRLTQAHLEEKHALMEQLNRKTKEAAVLTQQVDREVSEVADMIHNWEESRKHSQMKRQAKDELRALSHMP